MSSVVEINPLTRVEGHGSVKLYLDGSRPERVELCLTDPPRLFEALLVGKGYREVPEIICRICSLCSTIHKVTALLAVEKALGVEVSPLTRLTRELIVNGGTIQDHALHLYCLLLPDLFDLRGVAELALEAPELLKAGLAIKRVGNLIQERVGGRLIHPVNIVPGGLGRSIGKQTLLRLQEELLSVESACRDAVALFATALPLPPLPKPRHFGVDPAEPFHAATRLAFADGRSFPIDRYRDAIVESVLPHSHAKHARVLGDEPCVGALSRLNLGARLSPRTAGLFEQVRERIVGTDIRGNPVAQAVELCQGVERSLSLIDELIELAGEKAPPVEIRPRCGEGSAACEAPRGVLIHSYRFDDAGTCTGADVITPTSLNQGAISADLMALASAMEGSGASEIGNAMERMIRCYDPCISCSVHILRL
jgi:sulfhydrogenase subunit alpha